MPIPVSFLDLTPIPAGTSSGEALRASVELAMLADRLGYERYWFAEHHNTTGLASAAPEIMIGHVAGRTQHLRVGSGGVMLPNHAPLAVAERFKVLEGLFPDRIDLGLGRAPGTDPVTSYALRRRQDDPAGDDFLDRFRELLLFEQRGFPDDHPFRKVVAMPADVPLPPLYLLGSIAGFPQWLLNLEPFGHTPRIGADFTATPLVLLLAIDVALTALGTVAVRFRDGRC